MKIKQKLFPKEKSLCFLNEDIIVPEWTIYIAIDKDGSVNAFDKEPISILGKGYWIHQKDGKYSHVAIVSFEEDEDKWIESLEKY